MQGNDVLVIGDSVFAATHQVTAYLEALARSAGVLAVGERYRDVSSVTTNTLALGGRGIESQYVSATTDAPASLVIMNGGGSDALLGACSAPVSDCSVVTEAAAAVTDLFAAMASDGVGRVVYVFYPDYEDPTLRETLDALRPLVESACAESATPCDLVDLRPVFEGRLSEYTDAGRILPNALGAEATANAIWSRLNADCAAD